MTLWFVFALMTAAAIFAVLWPLSRRGQPRNEGSEAIVYKDQLAEINRDVAAGLIGGSEAEAARVEISRRLLAAAAADGIARQPAAADKITGAVNLPLFLLEGVAILAEVFALLVLLMGAKG